MKEDSFKFFLKRNILLTHEVADRLNISRQRISALHKQGELVPIKSSGNTSIYLLQDVLKYMEKKGLLPSYNNPKRPKFFCESSCTHDNVDFAKKHIGLMDPITRISIYFENIDAAIENYFFPCDNLRYGDLMNLEIAHMILHDISGNEMWLPGCNCGYGGTGPHGSKEILDLLEIPKDIQDNVLYHPIVKYVMDENGKWEVNERESDFDFRKLSDIDKMTMAKESAHIYWHQGRLSLLQDKNNYYSESNPEHLLEKYWAFIPNPVEYILFADDKQAIENGYFNPRFNSGLENGAYRLIIRDYTGRQLWLDPLIDKNKSLQEQAEIKNIIEACGFDLKFNDTNYNKGLTLWLERLLKKIDFDEPLIGHRNPF